MQLWLTAFAWTLAIELPIYTLIIGRCFRNWWTVVVVVLVINLVTHPMLWFVFPHFAPRWAYIAAGETTVTVIETVLVAIAIRDPGRAAVAAITANAASFLGGMIMWSILL